MIVDQFDGAVRLTIGEKTSDVFEVFLDVSSGPPVIVYMGVPTGIDNLDGLLALAGRPLNKAHLDIEAPPSICPEHGSGWQGQPGLRGHREDRSDWAPRFNPGEVTQPNPDQQTVVITCTDPQSKLTLATEIVGLEHSCRVRLHLHNYGTSPYWVNDLAATIPLPARATELQHFVGRWANEFQLCRREWLPGTTQINNRSGRTSHNAVPALFAGTSNFDNNTGEVWAFNLGWSGNSSASAELGAAGLRTVRLGELLADGDVVTERGETYTTPWLEMTYSSRGLNGVSQAFHTSIRSRRGYKAGSSPRPVTLNTWEAVYFDHDLTVLTEMADKAQSVGVERFVLDDG